MTYSISTQQMRAALKSFCNDADTGALVACAKQMRESSGDEKYYALLFMKMVEHANPDSQSELGDCYYQGIGVHKDIDKAVALFQSAANRGSARANYDMGWYHFDRKEYMQAIDYLKKCIEPESGLDDEIVGRSHRCIANAYAYTPNADMRQAVYHWAIAADKYRDSFATKKLGIWYSEVGTDHVDAAKAKQYLSLAAELGDFEAADRLADFYMHGEDALGINRNDEMAEQILLPFAEGNNENCQFSLGSLYFRKKKYDLSKKHYEKAWSIRKSPGLASLLGYVYYMLNEYANARELLEYADSEGDFAFSDFLGRMYKDGVGGKADLYKAQTYYENAYQNGKLNNIFTFLEYTELLLSGGKDYAAYVAADKGQAEHNDVAFVFIKAKLVLEGKVSNMISLEEAVELMEACIHHDYKKTEAHMLLGQYYHRSAKEFRKAENHFLNAYSLGEAEAACCLGWLYETGGGSITADPNKAYEWFVKAAAAGSNTGRTEAACFKKGLFGGYRRIKN